MEDFPTFEEQIQPIAHVHGHVHENQKAVINRISRALGHLEKVRERYSICSFAEPTALQTAGEVWGLGFRFTNPLSLPTAAASPFRTIRPTEPSLHSHCPKGRLH